MGTAKTVGARELKTRLGSYLDYVRQGNRIVVTDRGKPVAEISPIRRSEDPERAYIEDLAARGLATIGKGGPRWPFRPMKIKGPPLSQTIIEDREDRF